MRNIRLTAIVLGSLLVPIAAQAAGVTISGDAPRNSISVSIEDAKVDAVLRDLQARYKFQVSGLEHAARGEAISVTMTGSLHAVLERLLRNRNHMIVRSPDNATGIAKVMILNSNYGAAPQRPPVGRAEDYSVEIAGPGA